MCSAGMSHVLRRLRTTALSDSIRMVARASAVPRSAAVVLTVVAPAALVAPACKHHLADVSAGVRWAATDSSSLLARSQRLCCGCSSRALGLAEVVCHTERSVSAGVAAAPDDARCSTLLVALSSRRRALVTLRDTAAACALLARTLTSMEADGQRSRGKRSMSAVARVAPRRRRPTDAVHSAVCCAALGALRAVSAKWSW